MIVFHILWFVVSIASDYVLCGLLFLGVMEFLDDEYSRAEALKWPYYIFLFVFILVCTVLDWIHDLLS